MNVLLFLVYSLKNLKTHWKRTLMLLLAITTTFSMILTVDYLIDATYKTYYGIDEEYSLSQIVVFSDEGYFNSTTIKVFSSLQGIKGVEGYLAINDYFGKEDPILVYIYGAPKNPQVDDIPSINWDEFNGHVVYVDEGIAEAYGLRVGDEISILNESFEIIGIGSCIWAPSLKYGVSGFFIIPIETAWSILGLNDSYNEIRIRVNNFENLPTIAYSVFEYIEKMRLKANLSIRPVNLVSLLSNFEPILFLARLITLTVILSTLGFYVFVDAKSRTKEFGVLKSLGFSNREIVALQLTQVSLLVFISMILSVFASRIVAFRIIRGITYLPSINVRIDLLSTRIIFDSILSISLPLIVAFLIVSRIKIRPLNELIKFGDIDVRLPLFRKIATRFHSVNYALRSILTRKQKTAALILLVVMAVSLSSSFTMISNESYRRHIDLYTRNMKWDIMITIENTTHYTKMHDILKNTNGVESVEEIIIAPLPVLSVGSKDRKIDPPFNTLTTIGISGNETLIKFDYVEGNFSDDGVVITEKMAEVLNIKLEERIIVNILHPLGTVIGTELTVKGIIDTPFAGGWLLLFPLKLLENLGNNVNINPNTFLVKLDSNFDVEETAKLIHGKMIEQKIYGNIETKDKAFKAAQEYYSNVNYILSSIEAILITGVTLSITLIYAIENYRKKYEYALEKTLGSTLTKTLKNHVLESIIIATIALLLAAPTTYIALLAMTNWLNHSNLNIWVKPNFSSTTFLSIATLMTIIPIVANVISIIYFYRKSDPSYLSEKY